MAKRRWTLVLVPHGSEPSRIVEVSYRALKALSGGALLGLVAVLLARLRDVLPHHRSLPDRQAPAGECQPGPGARRAQRPACVPLRYPRADLAARRPHPGPGQPRAHRSRSAGRRNRRSDDPGAPAGDAEQRIRRSHEIRVDLNALIRRANLLASSFRKRPTASPSTPPGSPPPRRSCRPRAG